MSHEEIVRAWKSPRHRKAMSAQERAAVPAHPAGAVELPDGALEDAWGASTTVIFPPTANPVCFLTLECWSFAHCPVR